MSRNAFEKRPLQYWCDRILERTSTLITEAGLITGRALQQPTVRLDLRGQTAGQLSIDRGGHGTIRYNPSLLQRHGEEFLARTVPHEVAHYAAFAHHGRGIRPHGPEWRRLVLALGGEPMRCHDYDTAGLLARRTRWFLYHCRCGDQRLSSVRHNRVGLGARYVCRRCGECLRVGPASSA